MLFILKGLHFIAAETGGTEGSGALCVLVQGPSGCGKTTLLRVYASICGKAVGDSVVVVHLGEQVDSKVRF